MAGRDVDKRVEPTNRVDVRDIVTRTIASGGGSLGSLQGRAAIGGALVLLALLAYWAFGSSSAKVAYVTEPVTRGRLTVLVTATGSIQPTKKVDISSELSGTVRQVHVDYNSTVTSGQLLAELDTDKLIATRDNTRAKLDAAKAKVAEAEATIVERQKDLARKRPLAAKQFSSVHDLEAAQAAYDRAVAALESAKADVRATEAQLHVDTTNLAKSRIVSPIGGTVLKRNVEPGQTVAATLQAPVLFSIAEDLKQMEVQVDVDEADVGKVRVGQSATFTVDAYPGRRFPAELRLVRFASETVQGVVTYKAVLAVDNSDLLLRPGMTATAEIVVTEIKEALLVANPALRFTPSSASQTPQRSFLQRILPGPPFRPAVRRDDTPTSRTVWVLRQGVPTAVKISVGASDGKLTEIRGNGIAAGDVVIVDETVAR